VQALGEAQADRIDVLISAERYSYTGIGLVQIPSNLSRFSYGTVDM
jgi:hypothetical protein